MFRLCVTIVHLLAIFIRQRPNVVHFFLPAAYVIGAPLAMIARVPKQVMSRRSLNVYQFGLLGTVERVLRQRMDAILANSLSVLRELHDHGGVPADKLSLLYNGIENRAVLKSPRSASHARPVGYRSDNACYGDRG